MLSITDVTQRLFCYNERVKKLLERYRYSWMLLKALVKADFKTKYQDSILGYLWSALKPLFMFAIMYTVFVRVLKIGADIDFWPIALLLGIVVWQFFVDVTKGCLKSIVDNGSLLRKIKFPRYIVVVAGTVSAFITLLINLSVVVAFAIAAGMPLTPSMFAALPFLVEVFVFSLGIAFFLSAVYVRFRDIQYIWDVLVQGLFYASAIIFPVTMILQLSNGSVIAKVLLMNPVAQAIQDMRHIAVNQDIPSLWSVSGGNVWMSALPLVVVAVTFIVGAWYFRKKSPGFAEDV